MTRRSLSLLLAIVAMLLFATPAVHAEQPALTLTDMVGRDITLSGLYAALHVEGVQRVELIEPEADIVLTETQAGHCTGIALEFAGNDD